MNMILAFGPGLMKDSGKWRLAKLFASMKLAGMNDFNYAEFAQPFAGSGLSPGFTIFGYQFTCLEAYLLERHGGPYGYSRGPGRARRGATGAALDRVREARQA